MEIISKDKTKIKINKDVYKLSDIELIYTEGTNFIVCASGKRVKYKCEDALKFFREVASQIMLNRLDNFTLLLTGNNMVNLNTLEAVSLDGFDLKIQTKHHLYILNDVNCMEYMCLKGRLQRHKEKGNSR